MIHFPNKGIKVVPLGEKTYEDNQFLRRNKELWKSIALLEERFIKKVLIMNRQ